jgi:uncharacterized protein (TIGR00299 family) protein
MKVLRWESVGGASGDMILGALLDLGVDAVALERELKKLHAGDFSLRVESVVRDGLRGTLCRVDIPPEPHHHHHHDHGHGHTHAHAPHRGLREIEALLQGSTLPEAVKTDSLQVFRRIGEVEARLHGTTVEHIHFHEIGAVDSIVDIVGCCLARHWLGVEAVTVGPLPQGVGTIACAHGVFPNPAPATVDLLQGLAVVQTDEPHELVTPTGAGLLAVWQQQHAAPAHGQVLAAGYGFGQRTLAHRPNVLRAVLLDTAAVASATRAHVLECNLDDTSPELIGALSERLLAAGALDVFTTPVQMKKQRPGIVLTVLAESAHRATLLDLIFRESTTFGVREYEVERTVLARRQVEVETPAGRVRIKIGTWRGQDVTFAPEFEDCRARAREAGCAVREVYERALQAAQALRSAS